MTPPAYPVIGSTVTVTYQSARMGRPVTITGRVYADRYPHYALNVGNQRIPWSVILEVR